MYHVITLTFTLLHECNPLYTRVPRSTMVISMGSYTDCTSTDSSDRVQEGVMDHMTGFITSHNIIAVMTFASAHTVID